LARLLKEPVLGDLGCLEPSRVLEAIEALGSGSAAIPSMDASFLYPLLALESWLSVREGRYPVD
jgi:hypothetical protein